MFDDQMPKQDPQPQAGVEDIFDDAPGVPGNLPVGQVTPAPASEIPAPALTPTPVATPTPQMSPQPAPVAPTQSTSPSSSSFFGVIKVVAIVLIALGIIGSAGYIAFRMMTQTPGAVDDTGMINPNPDNIVIDAHVAVNQTVARADNLPPVGFTGESSHMFWNVSCCFAKQGKVMHGGIII